MKNKGWKQLGEKEFNTIKTLQGHGLTANEAAKVLKRSPSTVKVAYLSETLSDHKEKQRENRNKYRPVEEEQEEIPAQDKIEYVINESQADINNSLKRIADGIEALVEAWESKSDNKRKFF